MSIIQMLLTGVAGNVVTTDPYFNYTTLLLPGNGTNGANNNTFLDSSTNAFTITRNGNTTQGTFSPFSQTGWSNFISSDGSAAFSVAYNAGFAPGSGDFTVEAWVYFTGVGGADQNIIGNISASTGNGDWFLGWRGGANRFEFSASSSGLLAGLQRSYNTTVPVVGQWYHVVGVKSGSTLSCYVNGAKGTDATLATVSNGSLTLYIGQGTPGNGRLYGYISNARIVKGTAVYSGSSFTVPTAPLTAITNTQLLTCQSNRFVDNSTNNFTITVAAGTPSVQAFSPFNPTASYSTSTVGGSGYFDGSGDYLTAPSNAAFNIEGGAYTIEGWVYFNSLSTSQRIFVIEGSTTNGFIVGTGSTNNVEVNQFGTGTVLSASNALVGVLNSWAHICVVSNGTNRSIFVNGTRFATSTSALFPSSTNSFGLAGIGGTYAGSNPNAYFSGWRVVKGTAVYDPTQSTLTVPTAPLTAITNTQLLLNFTNGGITDATAKNDLETVNGASISTSVSKFGGSSMYFDGVDDNAVIPYNQIFSLGTADFTVEGWFYFPDISTTARGIIALGDGANGGGPYNAWSLRYLGSDGSNQLEFYRYDGTGFNYTTSGLTLSASTWYHIAVARYSGVLKIFVNGISYYSNTVTTDFGAINTNPMRIALQYYGPSPGYGGPRYWNGYINDLRITKGIARYTANFTPPTVAFPVQ